MKLEERTGNASVKFEEFALFVQTSDPTKNIDLVIESILKLREKKKQSTAKKLFNSKAYEEYGKNYAKKSSNSKEYGDANLRYLRQTGIFARNGRGIAIRKECKSLAVQLVKQQKPNLTMLRYN